MKQVHYQALVIGGGSAGLAAAARIAERGATVAVIEREETLGGILNQCIHNGFGLHYFNEELTGPEYAERFIQGLEKLSVDIFTSMTITEIEPAEDEKLVYGYSKSHGALQFRCAAVVLAMGCRERNRGSIGTPGTRPSGIFTAGLAQRLVNIDGMVPGRECVIVGSGDIGLIMARRMSWVGARVKAVVEIQSYPAGITRNIVQCLRDFDIPLYLSHVVTRIHGKHRVSGVDVAPLNGGTEDASRQFHISCDTLLLSVGLIPDNEIAKKAGVELNPETGGPVVDARLMTSVPGIFACGNVLHVHDLVDFVTREATRCGEYVCDFMEHKPVERQFPVIPGKNIKYAVPNHFSPRQENVFFLRSMVVGNNAVLTARIAGREVMRRKLLHVQPSEMISFSLGSKDLQITDTRQGNQLEIALETTQ